MSIDTATPVKAVLEHQTTVGAAIVIEGWVRSRRTSKGGFSFVHVNDGSCFDSLQIVAADTLPNYTTEVLELGTGCAVRVAGRVVESQGHDQDREVHADRIDVLGWVDDPETYPIAKKRHTFEYLRTVAHLRPRTNTFGAIARVRNAIAHAVHGYFNREGFLWVNTPIITASDCEGAGQLFRVSTLDLANRNAPQGRTPTRRISSAPRPTLPSRASSTSRVTASRSRRSTPSARPSGRKIRIPAGTSPSSG
jgi:asparaginyl-tRNA synthetase